MLVILVLNTGLRISELLTLHWRQLVRNGEPTPLLEVSRRFLKGGRGPARKQVCSRRVPLDAAAAAAIREFAFARFGSGPVDRDAVVFASRKRYPGVLSRRQAHTIISEAALRAGLAEGVAPHSLRRAFARDVYAATNHDLVATQTILGHASPLTTARYLRPRQEELDQVVLNLGTENVVTDHLHDSRNSAPCQRAHARGIAVGFAVTVPKSCAPYLSRK
jgi:integrase/recombinase XerD